MSGQGFGIDVMILILAIMALPPLIITLLVMCLSTIGFKPARQYWHYMTRSEETRPEAQK